MKKLIATVALALITFGASADTLHPSIPMLDTSLVKKTEVHPLEKHLKDMEVNFALVKANNVPVRLIVMSGSPEQYNDVNFLCRMAKEYGGVNRAIVYKTNTEDKIVKTEKDCN